MCIRDRITTDTSEFKYYEVDSKGRMIIKKLYLDQMCIRDRIETVTNREKFTGGCDAETDDELRKRDRKSVV